MVIYVDIFTAYGNICGHILCPVADVTFLRLVAQIYFKP